MNYNIVIFPIYKVSKYHIKKRDNYIELLWLLDSIFIYDIVYIILKYHVYNSIKYELYCHIDTAYYNIIINPNYHKRIYEFINIYLLSIFPQDLINMFYQCLLQKLNQ